MIDFQDEHDKAVATVILIALMVFFFALTAFSLMTENFRVDPKVDCVQISKDSIEVKCFTK